MGDEQIKQYIKNGVLTVPYGQKKAALAWLSDQFNLLKPDWDNPEVKFDSKLARKVVLLGIDKIHVEDKAGNIDPKFVTNVSALLDERGKLGFSSAKKQFQSFLKRVKRQSAETLDPKTPKYNTILKRLGRAIGQPIDFDGHIHHRFPLYVLGQILDRWEELQHQLAGKKWDGKTYGEYSKQLIRKINKKFGIPTGDDVRNLDFIKTENLKLHDAIHQMWNKLGFSKEVLPLTLQRFDTPEKILEFIEGPVSKVLKDSERMVDGVIPAFKEKTSGELGKFWRNLKKHKGKVIAGGSAISLASLSDIISKGAIGATMDVGLDEDVWGAVGERQKAINEDNIIAQHLAEADIRKESYKAIIQGIAGSAVIGKLGAAKYLSNPYTAVPFLTYAGIRGADAYYKNRTGEDLATHWGKFQDKRVYDSDKIEAGDRLKDQPLQGEIKQGSKLNPLEKIGRSVKNRTALASERFNPDEAEFGLSELIHGR